MRIYLAGPIDHCSDSEATDWREVAKKTLVSHECLDPMRRDYRGREYLYAEIVDQDLADVDAADIVLANCWKPGYGTSMEIFYAAWHGKTVLAVVSPDVEFVSPWLQYWSTHVYDSLEAAVSDIESGFYG